jgi:hypothetical protein
VTDCEVDDQCLVSASGWNCSFCHHAHANSGDYLTYTVGTGGIFLGGKVSQDMKLTIHLHFVTECHSHVVSTPASYLRGPRFKTQPRDWLS